MTAHAQENTDANGVARGLAADGPWLRYRDTGLFVLPYRHHALEFAALPFLAPWRQFDKICLELPAQMPVDRIRKAVRDTAPATGCILIPSGHPFVLRVPEYPGDPAPASRAVHLSSLLPVSPDAMLTFLRLADDGPERRPQIEFVDADMPIELTEGDPESQPFPHVDAQEAAERGLRAWYERWRPALQAVPPSPRDAYRETFMALRLMESVLIPGCRALFVCGALHWHRIEALLNARTPNELRRELARHAVAAGQPSVSSREALPARPRRNLLPAPPSFRFTACTLDPAVLHSLQMSDVPWLVGEFERHVQAGRPHVDRQRWFRQMVVACWERTGRAVPPRALAVMEALLQRRMLADGRWSCDLDRHVLPCARAAAGASFTHELEQDAMQGDLQPSGSLPEGRVVPLPGEAILVFVEDETHLVRFPRCTARSRQPSERPWRMRRPSALTDKEQKAIKRGGLMMKPPCEERLHRHMCDRARHLGHEDIPFRRRNDPRPFRGDLGHGPDARRSIRAQACGDNTLYVRRPNRIPKRLPDCDECPVVWIFQQTRRIADRVTDFFTDNSRGQPLLTSFFWFHERRRRGPIRISRVAWFVRLYRNLTPSWDREAVERKLISRLPPEKFCTVRPWDDGDLPFDSDDPDLAVACAVKWSVCDHIVVVRVDPGYRTGERVRAFARDRGIRLLEPSPASFDRILLDRYRVDHEIPTQGTWQPPDPIAARLVAPVPGFEPVAVPHPLDKQTGHSP